MIIRGILVVLVLLWIIGFALHVAGAAIHLLLVLAVILFLYHLLTRNRTV